MLHRLYIGADNETGLLDEHRIHEIVGANFPGYTAINARGMWQGKSERSLILEIETDRNTVISGLITLLKNELKQDAIGYQVLPSIKFI